MNTTSIYILNFIGGIFAVLNIAKYFRKVDITVIQEYERIILEKDKIIADQAKLILRQQQYYNDSRNGKLE